MNIASVLATKSGGVITVGPSQTIREVLALLARHNIGALVVVDGVDSILGIVTERDVVREAARNEALFSQAVSSIMTRQVVVGVPQDDLLAVGSTMTAKRIRHLPVTDRGKLIGMVSIGDVLKAQRDEYQGEVETLQTQLQNEPT